MSEEEHPKPDESNATPSPRRVVSLEDLAARANMCGTAAERNQQQVGALTIPAEQKLAPGLIAAAQLIAAAILHCTLAICERLTPEDATGLIEKIDEAVRKEMN